MSRVKQQAPRKRAAISGQAVKWSFRILSGTVVAVAYYLVFSSFFDTPIEHELKRSTRRIEAEYAQLEKRYDTLRTVLENVAERDMSVYKILFEAEPDQEASAKRSRRTALLAELETHTNRELSLEFDTLLEQVYNRIASHNEQVRRWSRFAREHTDRVLTIPAIQPVDNRQLTLLTASFGERIHPFFKTMSTHRGVDYSVATGTAVFATADGMVKSVQTRGQNAGVSLSIDHGNGYETVYSHLDKVVAQPGRRVSRGDIIAFSGNSGLSFAPHLHYEVWVRDVAVDPTDYFFMELDMPRMQRLKAISKMGMQSFD